MEEETYNSNDESIELALFGAILRVDLGAVRRLFDTKNDELTSILNKPFTLSKGRRELILNRAVCCPFSGESRAIIELLLKKGANPNYTIVYNPFVEPISHKRKNFNWNSLQLAIRRNQDVSVIKLLLDYGANIRTPYLEAVLAKRCVPAEHHLHFLRECPDKQTRYQVDCLTLAMIRGRHLIVEFLLNYCKFEEKLMAARKSIERGYTVMLKLVIASMIQHNAISPYTILELVGFATKRPMLNEFKPGYEELRETKVEMLRTLMDCVNDKVVEFYSHFKEVKQRKHTRNGEHESVHQLPRDIQKMLLLQMEPEDLFRCAFVCKSWRDISSEVGEDVLVCSPFQLYNLTYRFQNRASAAVPFPLTTIYYLKQWLPVLQQLTLSDCSGLRPRDLQILGGEAISLRHLTLKNFKYPLSIQHILDLFSQVSYLFYENKLPITENQAEKVITISSSALKELIIKIEYRNPLPFFPSFVVKSTLQTFELDTKDKQKIQVQIDNGTLLKSLKLGLLAPTSAQVVNTLKTCDDLRTLHLNDSHIMLSVDILKKLEDLSIKSSALPASELGNVIFPSLRSLTFSAPDTDQQKIISLIKRAPNLREIKCNVTPEFLSSLKQTSCNLESLDVALVPSSRAQQLVDIVEHFSELTSLRVTSPFLTRFDFNKLQQVAKNLHVLRIDNLLGLSNCIVTLPQLKTFQLHNSQISSLHILSNELETLDIYNCATLELLELIGECLNLQNVNIVPKYGWLKVKVSNPFFLQLLDQFE